MTTASRTALCTERSNNHAPARVKVLWRLNCQCQWPYRQCQPGRGLTLRSPSRRSHWHGASGPAARPQLQAASTGMPGRHASASAPVRGRPIRRAVYGTGRVNRRGGIVLSILLAYSRSAGAGPCGSRLGPAARNQSRIPHRHFFNVCVGRRERKAPPNRPAASTSGGPAFASQRGLTMAGHCGAVRTG